MAGVQGVYRHASAATGTDMTFSVFVPPQAETGEPLPVLWYLSGLTCTHANVTEKGEYRAACAEHGIIFVAPDTSPRGTDVPDDPEGLWDFGQGAGFYVDATEEPWAAHYPHVDLCRPTSCPALVAEHFPVDLDAAGDHRPFDGRPRRADLALRNPGPVPQRLGLRADRRAGPGAVGARRRCAISRRRPAAWRAHDAVALIEDGARLARTAGR